MTRLARLVIVGGGLAAGLIATGVAALVDKEKIKAKRRRTRPIDRPSVLTDLRKILDS